MPKHDFLPRRDREFAQLLQTMTQLAPGVPFISPAELTTLQTEANGFAAELDNATQKLAAAAAAVADKRAARKRAEQLVRRLARRWKADPAYTPAHGAALGILQADSPPDWNNLKPRLRVRLLANGVVRIDYNKGPADGVRIACRYDGEESQLLGFDQQSPYLDTRPVRVPGQPERRGYSAVYVVKDEPVGQWSAVYPIVCPG